MFRTAIPFALTAAAVAVGIPTPAHATIDVNDRYEFSFTETFDDCGLVDLVQSVEGHGVFTARQLKSSGGEAWFGHDNYDVTETFTNPANGRTFSITYNGNSRELRARQVSGSIWEFDWRDSGTTTLRDADGTALVRDRGSISATATYDLLGDGQLGAVLLWETDPVVNGVVTELEWCEEIVEPLLG